MEFLESKRRAHAVARALEAHVPFESPAACLAAADAIVADSPQLFAPVAGAGRTTPPKFAPTISFHALRKSRTTLQDFSKFYFPLRGLAQSDFFRWLPLLVFVEASIYALDGANEELAARGVVDGGGESAVETALRGVLKTQGVLDARVQAELANGARYWELERRLCAAMAAGDKVTVEEVHECSELKSFDYRLLDALLAQLAARDREAGAAADDAEEEAALRRFLRVDELLIDIMDDLFDYEGDVAKNSFNVLRGYAHAHGADAPRRLVSRISLLEREHAELLAALPRKARAAYSRNRRDEMKKTGADRWIFPRLILPADEPRFREECGGSESDDSEAPQPKRRRK